MVRSRTVIRGEPNRPHQLVILSAAKDVRIFPERLNLLPFVIPNCPQPQARTSRGIRF